MNGFLKTVTIHEGTSLTVREGFQILQLIPLAESNYNFWPGARVVILEPEDTGQPWIKIEFRVLEKGFQDNDLTYIGTSVQANPAYIAHFGYKITKQ